MHYEHILGQKMNNVSPEISVSVSRPIGPAVPVRHSGALAGIDERIVNATSPQEAAIFVRLREEIMRQNAVEKSDLAKLESERRNFWFRVGSSAAFLLTGTGLIVGGFALPGFFIVGGSLTLLAPGYVKHFIDKFGGREESDE